MTNCTWKDCLQLACNPQLSEYGAEWANLCNAHEEELNAGIKSGDFKKLMRAYVRAKGGAEKSAQAMQPEIKAAAIMVGKLRAI